MYDSKYHFRPLYFPFYFSAVNINMISTEKYVSTVVKDFFEGCCHLEFLFYEIF